MRPCCHRPTLGLPEPILQPSQGLSICLLSPPCSFLPLTPRGCLPDLFGPVAVFLCPLPSALPTPPACPPEMPLFPEFSGCVPWSFSPRPFLGCSGVQWVGDRSPEGRVRTPPPEQRPARDKAHRRSTVNTILSCTSTHGWRLQKVLTSIISPEQPISQMRKLRPGKSKRLT